MKEQKEEEEEEIDDIPGRAEEEDVLEANNEELPCPADERVNLLLFLLVNDVMFSSHSLPVRHKGVLVG